MAMKSDPFVKPLPPVSPAMKPSTSSASGQLTNFEIEQLRQRKKEIGAYAHEVFERVKAERQG